ncbi:unnamed protein product, partial [marine sediment metagenome]
QYFFEKEQLLEGWNLYKKAKSKQGIWNYKAYENFNEFENENPLIKFALLYHSMEPITSDSKKGEGKAYSLQKFGVYINEVADNLERKSVRNDILEYMKTNFLMRNVSTPSYRLMIRVENK